MLTNLRKRHEENMEKSKKIENGNRKAIKLPVKEFKLRNSLLTDLFENPHINTIYHIFAAILLGLVVNTLAHDYLLRGEIQPGFKLLLVGFGKVHISFLIWICMFGISCSFYPIFLTWANIRSSLKPKSSTLLFWDKAWYIILPIVYCLSFWKSGQLVTRYKLPPGSSAIVIFETVRMLMKLHAFVRENAMKVLKHEPHSKNKFILPTFSHYLYFFFAPTLIYRDTYPRRQNIRWKYVFIRLFEVICVVLNITFVIERLVVPTFKEFGTRKFTVIEVLLGICEMSYAGMLLKLYIFYFMLHSWENLFAELLRFGDRQFYAEWWVATSYGEYFRNWNMLIGDWLYTYIYKDMYENIVPKNKSTAKIAVFIVSAIVHEWLMSLMLGFFLPVMFIFFLFFGASLSFVRAPKIGVLNIFFWYGLAFGSGIIVSMYAIEMFARVNNNIENQTMRDFFVPRSLSYNCISI